MRAAIAAFAVGGALFASSASAATQTWVQTDDFSAAGGQSQQTLTVGSFNDSLGTFISASYVITLQFFSDGTVTNNEETPAEFYGSLSSLVTVPTYSPTTISSSAITTISEPSLSAFTLYELPGLGSAALDLETDLGSYTGSLLEAVADGVSPIDFVFNLRGVTSTQSTSSGDSVDVRLAATTTAAGSVTVTYTYDDGVSAVPLPAALPLMGAGLAALGFVARRRKS